MSWDRRHLLSITDLSAADLRAVFAQADTFAPASTGEVKLFPTLVGRVVVNAFFEDSTRTRMSFSLAARRLGAEVLEFTGSGSSVSKGETLRDTVRNIQAMGVDLMVVRHHAAGAARHVAAAVGGGCAVVNAGDGAHQHPTQGLLDLYTIRQRFGREGGDLSGLRVAVVGDVANSRVVRSTTAGLVTLGAEVVLVGPPTLAPASLAGEGVTVRHDLDAVLAEEGGGVDVIYMLRVQFERIKSSQFPSLREFTRFFGLTADRYAAAADRAGRRPFVMHPGPMNRGLEIAEAVADGEHSGILDQVTNGLAVRMAVLYLVSGGQR